MAPSLRSRPRSLSKIRIASSLMMSTRMPIGDDAIFVGDQTRRRMTLKVAPRQRAADHDGLRLPRLNGKDAHDAEIEGLPEIGTVFIRHPGTKGLRTR